MSTTPPRLMLALVACAAALALPGCKDRDETVSTAPTAPEYTPPAGTTGSATGTVTQTDNSNAVGTSGTMSAAAPLPAPDAEFVTKAAEGGQFEVEIARLAVAKASDAAVKSYAQMLVDDHSAANDKLRQIASSHNLALPAVLPADKKQEIDQLSKLSGAEFDRQFVKMIGIKDHRQDIDEFEKASKNSKSDDVKSFADSTLPTLKKHLAAAEKLPAKG